MDCKQTMERVAEIFAIVGALSFATFILYRIIVMY